RRTLDNGMARLEKLLASPIVQETKILSGADIFKLYDTFGFPPQLTQDIAAERGITADMDAYIEITHGNGDSDGPGGVFAEGNEALSELQRSLPPTDFLAYGNTVAGAEILGLLVGGASEETARPGDEVTVVLDRTPFYAESGGQVGD